VEDYAGVAGVTGAKYAAGDATAMTPVGAEKTPSFDVQEFTLTCDFPLRIMLW